ncbi:MAG: DMT family transporter [Elsteraceae bacterium]
MDRATTRAANATAQGLIWGGLGVLAFSMSLPATRLAVTGGIDGALAGLGRAVIAGLLAALVLLAARRPLPRTDLWPRLGLVALGVVLGFPLLTSLALSSASAGHGIIVAGLIPIATAVVAVTRSRERLSPAFWGSAAAGVAAVLLFALTRGAGSLAASDLLLLGAVAAAGRGGAEGGALAREMGGIWVICWALVLALPLTAALTVAAADLGSLWTATPSAWAGFAYLSIVSMFLGFFPWYRGLALGGVARVGQLQLAQPVLSLIWAALLLGEPMTGATLGAAAAVLACVVATQLSR